MDPDLITTAMRISMSHYPDIDKQIPIHTGNEKQVYI